MELLLSKKISLDDKLACNASISEILKGFLEKINPKTQSTTYNYIISIAEKYALILIDLSKEEPLDSFTALVSFLHSVSLKPEIIQAISSHICEGDFKQI